MRSNPRLRAGSTSRIAVAAGLCAGLAACDPAFLAPELRLAVTGTTDVGRLTLEVTPVETTLGDETTVFSYRVTSVTIGDAGFNGTISLSLSAMPPEVELVENVSPSSFPLQGSAVVDGTFKLRGLDLRDQPFEVQLTMTSVGTGGSRVVHPPVTVRLLRVQVALRVACQRDPDSGVAPLTVGFTAQPAGCSGPCRWAWDFGDGSSIEARNTTHVYASPGKYVATVTLSDLFGSVRCTRSVVVFSDAATQPPAPPAPTANQAPSVQNAMSVVTDVLTRTITATIVDPDPGDTVTWMVDVVSGPGGTLTPAAGAGTTLSSVFTVGSPFLPYTLRIRAFDNRGGQGEFLLNIPVVPN